MYIQKQYNALFILLIILGLTLMSSCKSTKYVPDKKYLLTQNIIKVQSGVLKEKDFEPFLKQKPNKRILYTFRFHLGLYNLSKPGSEKWMSRTLRKIGEEPSVYDFVLTDRTKQQMGLYLSNLGYYDAKITDSLVTKNKDAKVYYFIKTGKPYRLNKIFYNIEDTAIDRIVKLDTANCLIKPGSAFNVDQLQDERTRLETLIRNNHYFNFTKEYIYCDVDSSFRNYTVNLTLGIRKYQQKDVDGNIKLINHSQFKIGEIQVWIENRRTNDSIDYNIDEKMFDIRSIDNVEFIFRDYITIKPKLIHNNIYISENKYFSQKDVDETYKSLSSLKIFKFINIGFTEVKGDCVDSVKTVNCKIQLSTISFQSYQTDAELTSITGIGVAGSINYQHRNTFKGAEIFNLKFKGATEAVKSSNDLSFKNTIELGTEASLSFPKFILPFRSEQFTREFNPNTNISLSYNYMNRIQYLSRILNLSFGYQWKGRHFNSFIVKPFDINYVKVNLKNDSVFNERILSTYLQYSYQDHLVASSIFSYTYNNQKTKKNYNFQFASFNFESAGNSSRLFMNLLNSRRDSNGSYKIFDIKYAQYARTDIDIRHYNPINETDKIVFRIFAGIVIPYGNSKTVPFEKQYYGGGANSLRAWSARSLGPGSFKETTPPAFPDKASDIKLEGNIEYRFKLFWKLEGALFLDVGNIWSIKNDDREGAKFEVNKFVNQLAVGSGLGTRFDFSFFIFRIDFGLKLRDPAEKAGYRWIFKTDPASNITFTDLINPVFGIGYPF
jgi:outer membrane protein assembly factor BamA